MWRPVIASLGSIMKGVVDESCEPEAVLPMDVALIDKKTGPAFLYPRMRRAVFFDVYFLIHILSTKNRFKLLVFIK
jgi:hypothetical protein